MALLFKKAMPELKTFTEWLRFVEKNYADIEKFLNTYSKEVQECLTIFAVYNGFLELATPEEKRLLKKYGYEVDGPTKKINYIYE
jgi:hypothetical protein